MTSSTPRIGVQGYGGFHARLPYGMDGAVEMDAGFLVDVHRLYSEVAQTRHPLFRLHNHQVYVKRFPANLRHGLYDRKSERNVGDEDSVHDIEVKHIGLTAVYHLDFLVEIGEISRQE